MIKSVPTRSCYTLFLFATLLAAVPCAAQSAGAEDSRKSLQAQKDRAGVVYERGRQAHYTQEFDLSGLPHYVPGPQLTGWLRLHGSNYLADGALGEYWQRKFAEYQPGIRISFYLPTAAIAFAALYYEQADLVMGHRPGFYDLLGYQRVMNSDPVEFTVVTGSYDVAGWENSTVILVNNENPLKGVTMKQLDGIFGAARNGGWAGTNFRPDWARGPEGNIRTWGQLGLTGEWAAQPIRVYGVDRTKGPGQFFRERALANGEFREDMDEAASEDGVLPKLQSDKFGIAFTGLPFEIPGVKRLALAEEIGGRYSSGSYEKVMAGEYPLSREIYIYFDRTSGTPLDPRVKEFLRVALSRQGQEAAFAEGYLPLSAGRLAAELATLE